MEVFRPLLIAGLVVTEVGIWQWRMVIAHRGSRVSAMVLGIIGAVLQITAITQVVASVHDPFSIAAYAGGVGLGVFFGLVAGDRLTPGMLGVTIMTSTQGIARSIWELGWPATAQQADAEHGPVTVLTVTIARSDEAALHADVRRLAPDASWTTEELRGRSSTERPQRRKLTTRPRAMPYMPEQPLRAISAE